jgi:hypothetical protein
MTPNPGPDRFGHRFLIPAVMLAWCLAGEAASVTTVIPRNPGNQPAKNAPITLGQVIKRGDFQHGVRISVGKTMGQADIKRRYEDGSVRFAVISRHGRCSIC